MVSATIYVHPYDDIDHRHIGYGILSEAISCKVTHELGGEYELELTYPYDGNKAEYLALNNIIICPPNPYYVTSGEPFRIYEISRPINKIITVKAQHYRYDMSGYTVPPFEITEETTLREFVKFVQDNTTPSLIDETKPFWDKYIYYLGIASVELEKKTGTPYTSNVPVSLLSLLGGDEGSIPSIFGVEAWFNNHRVDFKEKPDITTVEPEINIMYGKNMTEFTWDSKSDNMYTAVYPFYYFENSDGVGELYEIPEKTISTGLSSIPDKWYLLDLSSSWVNDRYNWRDEYPTIEEMREVTNDFIAENNLGSPVHSITVSFIDESRINAFANYGYTDLEKCWIGDYVGVTFPDYECHSMLRIVKTTYDAIRDQYESVELGEITTTLSSGISSAQLSSSSFANGLASSLASEKAISINTHNLSAEVAKIDNLTADSAIITNIAAVAITSDRIEAAVADIGYIKTKELNAEVAKFGYLKADDIESDTGSFHYLDADVLDATYATMAAVRAGFADIDFANVNVANIGSAKLTEFFSRSGYVQHQTIGEQDVQYLRGVKIVGDIIEADTISAKSLILRTESETGDYKDGLIWQINAQSGELTQQQLTEEQYRKKLDGTDLVAHSVTAREITTEKIQGSTGYIQFGDEVQDDGTIIRGPNLNLNNELIYRNGKLELNLSSLDIKIGNAVNYAIDNVTIGGRNLLLNTGNISVTHSGGSTPYTIGGLYPSTSIPSGTQITISVQLDATDVVWGSSGYRRAGIEGYTGSQYIGVWGGYEVSKGMNVVKVVTGTWSGRVSKTYTLTADITTGTQFSLYVQQLSSGIMKVSNAKLEVGNKATDWSPAPEDSITYTDTVASKISSARVVTVSTVSGATLDSIKRWCALGAETNWGSIDEDVSSFQVGDLVYLKRKCSNFSDAYVYCKGNVKQVVDAHRLILSMLGFEAPMPTSNPIAYINATGETVKIEAKHVDITGAVTFSSFSSDLQSSYNTVSSNASTALTNAATAQATANTANSTIASVADTSVRRFTQTVDLSASTYNPDMYYPVVANNAIPTTDTLYAVSCNVQLNTNKPSWATHSAGFTVSVTAKYKCNGWGTTNGTQYCVENAYGYCGKQPAYAAEQCTYNSRPIFMLRGGGKYIMVTEWYNASWKIFSAAGSAYDSSSYQWPVAPVADPAVSMSGNRSGILKPTSERNLMAWCRGEDVTKIDGGSIYTNSIKANSISAGAITTEKLAANAVTAAKINVTTLESLSATIAGFTLSNKSMTQSYSISSSGPVTTFGIYTAEPDGSGDIGGNSITMTYRASSSGGSYYASTMNAFGFQTYGGDTALDGTTGDIYEKGTTLSNKYQAKGNYLASGGSIASGNTAGVTGGAIYSWLRGTNNRTRLSSEASSTVSCASGSTVNLHSVTLGAGVYVLTGTATLNAGSGSGSGRTWLQIATSSGGGGMDRYARVIQIGAPAQPQQLQITKIVAPTGNDTYYLVGGHNTGPTRTFAAVGFEALKIF